MGSGVSLGVHEAREVVFTAATTGLTKTIPAVNYPLTFVFRGSTAGSGPRCLGSLATTGDKLARVYGLDGACSAQHIGATTFANATTGGAQWTYGSDFNCVAVFQSQTDVRIYVAGVAGSAQAQSTTDVGTLSALPKLAFGVYDGSVKTFEQNGTTQLAQWFNVGMTGAQAWSLVRNPWQIFVPQDVPIFSIFTPGVVAYYPGSDISVAGWTPSTGTDLFACIDEPSTYNDADYITSPDRTTSAVEGWSSPVPAGTWSLAIRAEYLDSASGQIRLVMLDSGSSSVGSSAWQTLTGAFVTYTLAITTTGVSDRFRLEIQP